MTDFVQIGSAVNSSSMGLFSLMFVIVLWVVVFGVAQSNFEKSRYAFIVSSIVCLFATIGLIGIGWITTGGIIIFLITMSAAGLFAGIMIKD
jgi:hypothetical protein